MINVYFINGFLEAGKTSFIIDLLKQDYFKIDGRTMLLLCEEGEEEYESYLLEENNVTLVSIENEEDFNPEYIVDVERKIKPKRVIVEYNGMWNRKDLQFPWYWDEPIEITIIDANTFDMYTRNMKSLVSEQVRNAKMAILNRCDNLIDQLASYRRNLRAVNSTLQVVFQDKDGEINPRLDVDLPYDIHLKEIQITDEMYGVFYLDSMENVDRYVGKIVHFIGMITKISEQNGSCIVGRFAMTCCAEDLSMFGFVSDYEELDTLRLNEWVDVKAVIEKEYAPKYDVYYPTLRILELEECSVPKKAVVDII